MAKSSTELKLVPLKPPMSIHQGNVATHPSIKLCCVQYLKICNEALHLYMISGQMFGCTSLRLILMPTEACIQPTNQCGHV